MKTIGGLKNLGNGRPNICALATNLNIMYDKYVLSRCCQSAFQLALKQLLPRKILHFHKQVSFQTISTCFCFVTVFVFVCLLLVNDSAFLSKFSLGLVWSLVNGHL